MQEKKNEQLGMPFGTASARLKKLLLFSLVQETGRDKCFKCGEPIETAEQLSIEHKEDWLDRDPALFWDLNNIAYSHIQCNRPSRRYGGKHLRKTGPMGTAWCRLCQKFQPIRDFGSNKYRWNGLTDSCRESFRADRKRYRSFGDAAP